MQIFKYLLICLTLSAASVSFADVTEIDNAQLEKLRKEGVAIIDVRRLDEWQTTGLVEGSHPLTFFDAQGQFDVEQWLRDLDGLAKSEDPVVLICASGVRSARIAEFLEKKLGFADVYNVTRGINAWIGEQRSIVKYQP